MVGFEAVRYTVGEEEGAAEVCFNKSADTEVELEFRISIVPGSALGVSVCYLICVCNMCVRAWAWMQPRMYYVCLLSIT